MPSLDMNMNMNMSLPALGVMGRWPKARFNTDLEPRLADVSSPDTLVPPIAAAAPNYPYYTSFWDADLQSYMYLDAFLKVIGNDGAGKAVDWQPGYQALATTPVPANAAFPTNTPPSNMTRADLGAQVKRMLELSLEREDRFAEILDQDAGLGAIDYWVGMLKIDAASNPGTSQMVHVARRIGEYVSMCLKGYFRCPRPSQVAPSITPMFDPPRTPSFPAGHAIQSYLISYLLAYSLADNGGSTNLPQHTLPSPTATIETFLTAATRPRGPLFDLAKRVSENRIVAGLHYPVDIRAGRAVATKIFQDIQNVPSIWTGAGSLRSVVRGEFPQYAK